MISVFYIVFCSAVLMWLSFEVIKQRRKSKVKYSDGGEEALIRARSAHSNAIEYMPITMLMLVLAEYNGAYLWTIHVCGLVFIVGRICHGRSILSDTLTGRRFGMYCTFLVMQALMIINVICLPWQNFF